MLLPLWQRELHLRPALKQLHVCLLHSDLHAHFTMPCPLTAEVLRTISRIET